MTLLQPPDLWSCSHWQHLRAQPGITALVPRHTLSQSITVSPSATQVACGRYLCCKMWMQMGSWCSSMDQGSLLRKAAALSQAGDQVFSPAAHLSSHLVMGLEQQIAHENCGKKRLEWFCLLFSLEDWELERCAAEYGGQEAAGEGKASPAPQPAWCQHLCLQSSFQLSKAAVLPSAKQANPFSREWIPCLEGTILQVLPQPGQLIC